MMHGALGVLIATVGAVSGSFGDTFCRYNHARAQQRNYDAIGVSKLFVAQVTLCAVVENFLTLLSLNFASAAIVTPIGALHIVLNKLLSKACVDENLMGLHYVGCAAIFCGLLMTISVGVAYCPVYSVEQLLDMYTDASSLMFFTFCLCAVGLFAYASLGKSEERETTEIVSGRSHNRRNFDAVSRRGSLELTSSNQNPPNSRDMLENDMILTAGASQDQYDLERNTRTEQQSVRQGSSRLRNVISRRIVTMRRVKFPWGFRRFSINAISGISGGNAIVLSEGILKALQSTNKGFSITLQWQFVFLFLLLLTLVMTQLYCLNKGIDHFEGHKTIAQTNGVLIAFSCLASLTLFSSVLKGGSFRWLLFVGGTACIIIGIIIISQADIKLEVRELQALELTLGNAEFRDSSSVMSSLSTDTDEEAERDIEAHEMAYKAKDAPMTRPVGRRSMSSTGSAGGKRYAKVKNLIDTLGERDDSLRKLQYNKLHREEATGLSEYREPENEEVRLYDTTRRGKARGMSSSNRTSYGQLTEQSSDEISKVGRSSVEHTGRKTRKSRKAFLSPEQSERSSSIISRARTSPGGKPGKVFASPGPYRSLLLDPAVPPVEDVPSDLSRNTSGVSSGAQSSNSSVQHGRGR